MWQDDNKSVHFSYIVQQHPIKYILRHELIVRFETTSTFKVRLIIPVCFNSKLLVLSKFETTSWSKLLVNEKKKQLVVRTTT